MSNKRDNQYGEEHGNKRDENHGDVSRVLRTFADAAPKICDADLLLFRRFGAIAVAGRGHHSHAAKAVWWGETLFCIEVREWYGGRAVPLETLVRRLPGRIDVYRADPDGRWPEYDRACHEADRRMSLRLRKSVPRGDAPPARAALVFPTAFAGPERGRPARADRADLFGSLLPGGPSRRGRRPDSAFGRPVQRTVGFGAEPVLPVFADIGINGTKTDHKQNFLRTKKRMK